MENIVIRKVRLQDIILLQQIGRQTFYETFAASNTEENMSKYLKDGFAEAQLRAELGNEASAFYFATLDGNVIGYLKLNFGDAQTELQDQSSLEIERIYVLQEYQGKKVGQVLYDKAIQIAYEKKADYVWLGVWEDNQRAIHFYQKNEFVPFDKHIFKLGDDEQTDIMMKKKL